jgi:adenine C2-methylase RlmN of 23S rRNA A2503 and tRNA A37
MDVKEDNIAVTLRQKRGTDIDAACGQLRRKNLKSY